MRSTWRSRRSSIASGESAASLAAANSRARGSPSRRTQMPATTAAFAAVSVNPGSASCALSTKNCTASHSSCPVVSTGHGRPKGGTSTSHSPRRCSLSRLVARTFTRGQAVSISAISGAASSTCSKLSRRSSICLAPRYSLRTSMAGRCPPTIPCTSSVAAMVSITSPGLRSAAKSTKKAPCGNRSAIRAAAWRASRVFPVPPGPVSVTRRTSWLPRAFVTSSISASRPMNGVG